MKHLVLLTLIVSSSAWSETAAQAAQAKSAAAAIAQEAVVKEAVAKDSVAKDSVAKDSVAKDKVSKVAVTQQGAVSKEAAQRIARVIAATRSETAEEAVDLATQQMLDLIEAGQAYVQQDPERFYVEVEALFSPLIDFPRFARNVMGVYYKQADADQRQRFAESFKWSLVRTYALALTEFRNGQVTVLQPRQKPRDPDKVNVTQEIVYQGKTYVVVYRMQRRKGEWQLQNLIIEGVNVGLNYKSQFAAAMKDPQYNGDLDAVIDAWSKFIDQESTVKQDSAVAG